MKKNRLILCNPPVNFVKNQKTHFGHLFYLTLLDVTARWRSNLLGDNCYYPSRSYNLYGLPSEKLIKDKDLNLEEFKDFFKKTIKKDESSRNLNLLNLDIVTDDGKEVEEYFESILTSLMRKKFLKKIGEGLYIDLTKIDEKKFVQQLNKIRIVPESAKKTLIYQFKIRKSDLHITRDRKYSVKVELSSEKVAPFFIVSNFWNAKYSESRYIHFCPHNLVLRSALLRILTDFMLGKIACLEEVVIFPKILGSERFEQIIPDYSRSPIMRDLLRIGLMKCLSIKKARNTATRANLAFAVRLVKALLSWRDSLEDFHFKESKEIEDDFLNLLYDYKYSQALDAVFNKLSGSPREVGLNACDVLSECLVKLEPFAPKLTELIKMKDFSSDVIAGDLDRFISLIS